MQSEDAQQATVEADQRGADAADSFEPGAVEGADGGVGGGEDLEVPGGRVVDCGGSGGFGGEGGEGREGGAGVACCVDEDLAGFEDGSRVRVLF